jgi:uncharacterized protein (DUF1800 family)
MRVNHLYRRLGFGISHNNTQTALGQSPSALVDQLIDEAINMAPTPAPAWANWTNLNYPEDDELAGEMRREQIREWTLTYVNAMLSNNLRDRLSFFWSNHFVTEIDVYRCPSYLYGYINTLQIHSIGNFRTFVSEIGLNNAMLRYLDGYRNYRNRPNENYARELYELFTLGEGNGYTEDDIVETARALTGYVQRGIEDVGCSGYNFDASEHDTTAKTIFGQTGNWGYDDVINILFTQRENEVAYFICEKLYKFFVHPDPDPVQPIISGMAETLKNNNFELAPVLRQLFKSQHFFDENAIGVIIKSPFDFMLNFVNETSLMLNDELIEGTVTYCDLAGQLLFDPVDVAGWQRDRNWISANSLISRWSMLEYYLFYNWQQGDQERFREFAIELAGSNNTDPDDVTRKIVDKLVPKGLFSEADYQVAIDVFKPPVQQNYYDDNLWNLTWQEAPLQVFNLLLHISRQPEFELK